MNIRVLSLTEDAQEARDYRDALEIQIDGEKVFGVYDGEPEDSNLSRDFSDCKEIAALLMSAYTAGANGEEINIEYEEVEEI